MKSNVLHARLGRHSVLLSDAEESCVRESVAPEIRNGWFEFDDSKCTSFIDVGANIGMVSIYVALEHPSWRVFAVEPFPENYRNLCRNIAMNKIENIVPLPFAVHGSFDSSCHMLIHPTNTGGATNWTVRTEADSGHCARTVVAVTLDSVFERIAGPTGSRDVILKMDIEGAEHDTLVPFRNWGRLSHIHLESHMNNLLREMGHSHKKTRELVESSLPSEVTRVFAEIEKGE